MRELMALLSRQAFAGYPDEYLLARLRGRRAKLGSEHHSPAAVAGMTDADAWDRLRSEYRWVYRQMNAGLRLIFAPLFLWFELRTIILCLRFRRRGERLQAAGLLPASLLAKRVQQTLETEGEPATVINDLASILATVAEPYRDLGELYRQRGGRELEQRFVTLYLERMTVLPLHPLLQEFFRALVDMRNLVTLAKQIRWQVNEPQAFIRGGEITPARLGKALTEGTATGLNALLAALPDMSVLPPDQLNPEQQLYGWLTRKVRRLGRDPLGIGLILDYLWGCFVEAHDLSLTIHGQELESDTLRAELIR